MLIYDIITCEDTCKYKRKLDSGVRSLLPEPTVQSSVLMSCPLSVLYYPRLTNIACACETVTASQPVLVCLHPHKNKYRCQLYNKSPPRRSSMTEASKNDENLTSMG